MREIHVPSFSKLNVIDGNLELIKVSGGIPIVENGVVKLTPGMKIVDYFSDRNKITRIGRIALADIAAGLRPSSRIGAIELGVGAYGLGNAIDPKKQPPDPTGQEVELAMPTTPATRFEIDPVSGVSVPGSNLLARTFTVVINNFEYNFDPTIYYGVSEFGLKLLGVEDGQTNYPEVLFAIKHRKPIIMDDETVLVIRWTIQF